MHASAHEHEPPRFDLVQQAADLDRINRPKRAILAAFSALCMVAGGVGWALIGATPRLGSAPVSAVLGELALGLIFPVLAVLCFWNLRGFPRSPTAVSVTREGIEFNGEAPAQRRVIRWNDGTPKIMLCDFRPLGPTYQDRVTPRRLDIVVMSPRLRVRAPLTVEVAQALVEQAVEHRLVVEGWNSNPTVPGPIRDTRIRAG